MVHVGVLCVAFCGINTQLYLLEKGWCLRCSNLLSTIMCNVRSAIGLIQEGDLVIKDWVDPPLHLICSKRVWATSIADILQSKKEYKDVMDAMLPSS